jgi:hypothetical protein
VDNLGLSAGRSAYFYAIYMSTAWTYNPVLYPGGGHMSDKKAKAVVIDAETGEVTGEVYDGDRIIRKASVDYLNNTQIWKLDHFFKGHIGELRNWSEELTIEEKAFLFSIATYIGYEDCHIRYDNGKNIGTEDLVKISHMSRSTVYEVIKSLISKDILYRGKNSKERQYFINPWIFVKGNRINKVLKTMFCNYKIRVLGGVAWKNAKIDS